MFWLTVAVVRLIPPVVCLSVCLCVTSVYCGYTRKRIKLVFDVRVTTQYSYFVLDEGSGSARETRHLRRRLVVGLRRDRPSKQLSSSCLTAALKIAVQ